MLAWLLFALAHAQQAEPPGLRPGDVRAGAVEDGDPVVETEALLASGTTREHAVRARAFRLEVDERGTYRVELRSDFFDAYLILRDGTGAVLAEDDDGLLGLHSRLVIELSPDEARRVEACALHGGRGAFELRLERGEPPAQSAQDRARAEIADARRRLQVVEAARGGEHLEVAGCLNKLGYLLHVQGDSAAAKPLYERALAIRVRALGGEHLDVARSLNNLAGVLQSQGDLAGARPLYERALAIHEQALGGGHPLVATSLNNLANLLSDQGDVAGARSLHERALAIREQVLGPEHPDVAVSLNNLAVLLQDQGDYAGARPLLERALAIKERVLGGEDPSVAQSLENLALLLAAQGDAAGARPLHERALAIRERAFGGEHPAVAESLNDLAILLAAQGDAAGARPLYERALAIKERALGGEHPSVAQGLYSFAAFLKSQGDHAGARPLYERALAIYERAPDGVQVEMADVLHSLAALRKAEGDAAGARPLYERALAIHEQVLGGEHPYVAIGLHNLAVLLHDQGDYSGARPLYERALAIYERALGAEHPNAALSAASLAMLLVDAGLPAESLDRLAQARLRRGAHLGRTLAALSEGESHAYLAALRWQQEVELSSEAWGAPPVEVYESLLAWKGQVLRLARLGRARLLAGRTAEAREQLERLHVLQGRLSRSATRPDLLASADGERAGLEALIAERRQLERELRQGDDPLAIDPPGWEELRAALPARSALLDVFVHRIYQPAAWEGGRLLRRGIFSKPRVVAWLTRAGLEQPVRYDFGPAAALEAAVRAPLEEIAGARGVRVASAPDPDDALRAAIWDPLLPHLQDIDTVFVSPDGALAALPFEILRDPQGRYLVQDRSFVYLTDPTLLVEIVRGPAATGPASLVVVGDVDYERAEGAPPAEAAPGGLLASAAGAPLEPASDLRSGSWTEAWRPLAGTSVEAGQVMARHAAAFPEERRVLIRGSAATEERLKAELPRHGVLHLATHGYFQPEGWASLAKAAEDLREGERPAGGETVLDVAVRLEGYHAELLSGLVCAGAGAGLLAERDDGYLTAEEVGWLDLSGVDLAVLSACDTGLGRPQSGEGLLGLRRALLLAGAKTVVASLWSVPDQETAELMDSFYRNLWQGGLGPHAALRAAQLETLARNRARHAGDARPFTWGAFVLDGDWR